MGLPTNLTCRLRDSRWLWGHNFTITVMNIGLVRLSPWEWRKIGRGTVKQKNKTITAESGLSIVDLRIFFCSIHCWLWTIRWQLGLFQALNIVPAVYASHNTLLFTNQTSHKCHFGKIFLNFLKLDCKINLSNSIGKFD